MWVVGQYAGNHAKRIQALADEGIGYFIVENAGTGRNPVLLAAFRYEGEMPLPYHLEEVKDPRRIDEYEKRRVERQGFHVDNEPVEL